MMTRLAVLLRDRCGVVAAEFAICASLTVIAILFVFEAGLMCWTKVALQAAAADAARCGALSSSACSSGVPAYAVSVVNTWLFPGVITTANVTVNSATSCNGATGKYTVVTITSSNWYSLMLPANMISGTASAPALSATSCYVSGT